MKLTIKELRKIIREMITESGGGVGTSPHIRDVLSPSLSSREQLSKNTAGDNDYEEELSPHLRAVDDPEEEWDQGPVPADNGDDFYAVMDPYTNDWSVLPTKPFHNVRG